MPKIVIKILPERVNLPTRETILKILFENGVEVSEIRFQRNLFHVYCCDDSNSDKVFAEACLDALRAAYCEPILPPQIKAKRSVILRNLDQLICENDVDDIKREIIRSNVNIVVDEVFKFRNNRMLKITFSTYQMALKCIESGIYLYSLRIPPRNIDVDQFIDIMICYRCYKLDDHTSDSCGKSKDYLVCSTCSVVGHGFRNCTADKKQCINCHGDHSTLAMSCPEKKKIMREKRKDNNKSYATSVLSGERMFSSKSRSNTFQLNDVPVKTDKEVCINDIVQKSTLCLMIATMKESENSGCFVHVLNGLLEENGLSKFSMGTVAPPKFNDSYVVIQSNNNLPMGSVVKRNVEPPGTDKKISDCDRTAVMHARTFPSKISTGGGSHVLGKPESKTGTKYVSTDTEDKNEPETFVVYKKKGLPKITANNIEALVAEKKVCIGTNDIDASDLAKLMKTDAQSIRVIELPIRDFNQKVSSGLHCQDRSNFVVVN